MFSVCLSCQKSQFVRSGQLTWPHKLAVVHVPMSRLQPKKDKPLQPPRFPILHLLPQDQAPQIPPQEAQEEGLPSDHPRPDPPQPQPPTSSPSSTATPASGSSPGPGTSSPGSRSASSASTTPASSTASSASPAAARSSAPSSATPLLLEVYRHADGKMWLGFTALMEELLEEERRVADSMEADRVDKVRRLLMMSADKRIALSKIHHCRSLFGIPEDFRDRALKYPDYFRVVVDGDGRRVLELVNWDPHLAVSELEREFVVDEDGVKKAFRFPVKHNRDLDLDADDTRKLNLLNTLPLVSPYSDGASLDLWTLEAEKYRVGVLHEFLSLTLEKRASIHHIVEFKEEFSLTKHTYQMLLKQPRTFYLAGTEMNWVVFLKDAYDESGVLIRKDPQVLFNEKLYQYAGMTNMEPGMRI
ncbi:hypothetical protein NL676_024615 [Syzygium grande]|nr:hypothetical protein NL676_024615 [Syzygium grande]